MQDRTYRYPVLTGIFILLLLVALGFGAHALWMVSTRLTGDGVPPVEGWMTPRHVVSVHGLPPGALAGVLGVAEEDTPFATLDDLAAERGIAPEALLAEVQAVVDRAEAGE